MKKLYFLFTIILCAAMPIMAQHTDDNRNKAVFQSTDGNNEVNTDDIQLIRFEGGKVTVVQPWGETVFDHTLQNLTFFRPQSGTLRLTVDATIDTNDDTNRAFSIDGSGRLVSTWAEGDKVYVYSDEVSTSHIGVLTPATTGSSSARLVGDVSGLSDKQTLYLETQPRTYSFASQTGSLSNMFYAKAEATVSINGGNATISDATFTRPMAVVKFTLKDKANGTTPLNATSLTINYGSESISITSIPSSIYDTNGNGVLFVAIPSISGEIVSLTATVGSDTYTYNKTGVTFANGKYYSIGVKMTRQANTGDIGKIIATNGCIYDHGATLPTGVSEAGMIAYVGNESDCAHGLAIALADETGDKTFGTAGTTASQKNTDMPVVGGTWRIPSKADWENMFLSCRKDGDASSAATDMTIAGFKEKISSVGTGFTNGNTYWTSTDSPSVYCIYFSGTETKPNQVTFQGAQYKMSEYKARAVLAF